MNLWSRLALGTAAILTAASAPEGPPAPAPTSAWVTFDAQRVTGSGASGLAERASGRALTVNDPVRVASVSKLVVGLGVMRLVEQRRLDLDQDVSRWLGWPLRNPAYPERPITLRFLLSHRSGLTDASDEAIPPGQTVQQATHRPGAFDRSHPPGDYFRYANLNFVVIGAVMERATGERFDRLMRRLVLRPLGMQACFGWNSCTRRQRARGVTLYGANGRVRADGLEISPAICLDRPVRGTCDLGPYVLGTTSARYSPQGGLRTSMTDLAKVGRLFLNDGRYRGRAFLQPSSLRTLIGPAWRYSGMNGDTTGGIFCTFGLAVQTIPTPVPGCKDRLREEGRELVGHPGEAYGLLSGLWIDRAAGKGIAYFSANESGDRNATGSAFFNVERQLAGNLDR